MLKMRRSSPNDPAGNPKSASGSVDQVMRPLAIVPLPRGNLGHVHRHPEPLLVLLDAAVRHGQRRRAFGHAQLELLVDLLQRFLRLLPRGDLALELVVQTAQRARLAVQVDEDRHFRAQDVGR